jgi:hypothetical protein
VREAGCGYTIAPEDPAASADAALRLQPLSAEERCRIGANGREYVVKHRDYRDLARRFLDAATGGLIDASPAESQADFAPVAALWSRKVQTMLSTSD